MSDNYTNISIYLNDTSLCLPPPAGWRLQRPGDDGKIWKTTSVLHCRWIQNIPATFQPWSHSKPHFLHQPTKCKTHSKLFHRCTASMPKPVQWRATEPRAEELLSSCGATFRAGATHTATTFRGKFPSFPFWSLSLISCTHQVVGGGRGGRLQGLWIKPVVDRNNRASSWVKELKDVLKWIYI